MDATQEHLLKLILEIDRICKKYDIQYFLDYGLALGAIRHEGFIPWDDDADVTFTEDNYYKWIEACKKELDPEKRAFRDSRLDREFATLFGRYIDLETMRLGESSTFYKNLCGQVVDVFCLIELPGRPSKKQKVVDQYFAYDEYANVSYRHYRQKNDRWMRLYKRHCFWGKIFGRERVLRHLEKKIFNHHYADCDTYLVCSARGKVSMSIVPKKCFDTVHYANFEGHKLPIPGKYVEAMLQYYGDSYPLLPEKKRQHAKMSPSHIGCANYVADYMRYIDKRSLLQGRWRFKNLHVEEGYRTRRHNRDIYEKLGEYERLQIKTSIEATGLSLSDCLDPTDKTKLAILDRLFAEYYLKQLNGSVRYWESYLDIGDDLLYSALFNLIYYRYDFSSVAKILELRMLQDISLSSELQNMYELIILIRRVKAEIQYENFEEADKLLTQGLKKYPQCKMLLMDRLTLDTLLAINEEDYRHCEQEANHLLELYPDDDQGIKALGDIAWARENYIVADKYYNWLIEHSNNGIIQLDIRKKLDACHE